MRFFDWWLNDLAFIAAASALAGIIAGSIGISLSSAWWGMALAACGFVIFFWRAGAIWAAGIGIACFAVGMIYFHIFENTAVAQTHLVYDKKISFDALVIDEPSPSEKFLTVTAEARPPFAGQVILFASPQSVIAYGDVLRVAGKISAPREFGGEAVLYLPEITVAERHKASWMREKLIGCKQSMLAMFEGMLPRDEAGLLGGIAFGSKAGLSANFIRALGNSGTTHLVAVSGYNITIVLYAVEKALGKYIARRMMLATACALAFLFIVTTGLTASAVRAGVMGCVAVIAAEMGGVGSLDMRNILVISALAMSFFDPMLPAHNLGFQLSFISLAGIVYLEAPLRDLLRVRTDGWFGWKGSAVTTLAAQLAVFPILSSAFRGVSPVSLAANVMVLGTIPATMVMGCMLAMVGFVSSYPAFGVAQSVHMLLAYQVGVITVLGGIVEPVSLPSHAWLFPVLYYGGLIWFAAYCYERK